MMLKQWAFTRLIPPPITF